MKFFCIWDRFFNPMAAFGLRKAKRHRAGLRRLRGLTTIELLAGLAIVALLTAGIAGGLNIGRNSWRLSAVNERRAELEAAGRAISHLLAQSATVSALDLKKQPRLMFSGDSNSATFVYLNDSPAQWGGFILARLALDETQRGKLDLWSSVFRAENAWSTTPQEMQKSDLIDGLVLFEMRYFGAYDDNNALEWRKDWKNAKKLPQMIHIRFTRRANGREQTFDQYVALRHD